MGLFFTFILFILFLFKIDCFSKFQFSKSQTISSLRLNNKFNFPDHIIYGNNSLDFINSFLFKDITSQYSFGLEKSNKLHFFWFKDYLQSFVLDYGNASNLVLFDTLIDQLINLGSKKISIQNEVVDINNEAIFNMIYTITPIDFAESLLNSKTNCIKGICFRQNYYSNTYTITLQ
jgi:hypothetical protein